MKKRSILKAAVYGVILGTVAGYLFNPKKGKENREKVKKVSHDLIKRLKTEVGEVGSVTKKHYDEIVSKVVQDFKTDKALSKEAWDEVADELKLRWADISKEVKRKVKKTPAKKTTTKTKNTKK